MSEKTRIAIVGCGFMGRMHANVYRRLENVDIHTCFDLKPEKNHAFATEFGCQTAGTYEEILRNQEVDVVDICLPTYLHSEFSTQALLSGKHVFCEKPMALNVDQANHMRGAAASTGRFLMIGHCIRFWPEYVHLKETVSSGKFGKLLSLNMTRFAEFPYWSSDNWMADETKSGGGVLDMHIHDTDFALYLLGLPKSVFSRGVIDYRGPSHVFSTFEYDECIVHLEGGWNLPQKTPFNMSYRAIFENGAILFDENRLVEYQDNKEPIVVHFESENVSGGGNISSLGGYFFELSHFVNCVRSGTPSEVVTSASSIQSLQVVLEEISQIKGARL